MKYKHALLTILAAAVAASTSHAQSFNFPSFPNTNGLALNGSVVVTGNLLQLTPNIANQMGSVFYDQPVDVAGGFTTTFVFRVSQDGADGFTFVIQNDPRGLLALGDDGTALGYAGYTIPGGNAMVNSIAIEFDTWMSGAPANDTSANEVSIHTDGVNDNRFEEDFSLGNITPPLIDMSDGVAHTVRIDYTPGTLSVFLDDLVTPLLVVPYDFGSGGTHLTGSAVGGLNLINGSAAYVGFTGTTGGVTELHDILSWEFSPFSIGAPYCMAANNSTGVPGSLAATGSAAVSINDLTLTTTQLPANSFGFYLTSRSQSFTMNPGGSAGNLCLGGAIGRYVGAGQIQNAGVSGSFELTVDLTMTPQPTGLVQILSGETWNFQTWFRDAVGGTTTSNFTNGLEITFL